jgi:hypothetical protein
MDKSISQLSECDYLFIIDYFQAKNVLHKGRYCPKCNIDGQRVKMKIAVRTDIADGYGWRCSRCSKRVSLRKDTFFDNFRISFRAIVSLIIHWAIQSRQQDTADLSDCNRSSIISFQQSLRKAASRAADHNNTVIGGPGRIDEIDESLYIKERLFLFVVEKIMLILK